MRRLEAIRPLRVLNVWAGRTVGILAIAYIGLPLTPCVAQRASGPLAEPTEEQKKASGELLEHTTAAREGISGLTECGEMAARYQSALKWAGDLEKMNGFLDKLGSFLTAASAARHANDFAKTGDASGLVDDAQGLIVSKGGCALFTIFCPVYSAGMGIGTIINYAPKAFGWDNPTLNDMWTDVLVSKLYPVPDDAQIQQGIAELRARMQKARSDASAAEGRNAQCIADVKRKSAVEDMLKTAQPPAVRSPSASYSEDLFEQSAADTADPYSTQSLANRRAQTLNEVNQLTHDSNAQAQAASAAVLQQGLSSMLPSASTSRVSPIPTTPVVGPQNNSKCIASEEVCQQILTGLPPGTTIQDYQKGLSKQVNSSPH